MVLIGVVIQCDGLNKKNKNIGRQNMKLDEKKTRKDE